MSKVTITFDLDQPEDKSDFKRAVNADSAYRALWEISQEIFRPYRKHGYLDPKLNALLEHEDERVGSSVYAAIEALESKFWEILKDSDVNLDDC